MVEPRRSHGPGTRAFRSVERTELSPNFGDGRGGQAAAVVG
jgi:hypothetical protein